MYHRKKAKKVSWISILGCIASVGAVLAVGSLVAKATTPQPMIYEVKDSNGSYLQVYTASLAGLERTYAYNVQWGTGFRHHAPELDVVGRVISDVAYYKPTLVFIEMSLVDGQYPEDYQNYAAVIDQIMTHISVPVVWLQVPLQNSVSFYGLEGVNTINAALVEAEGRYSNLWAVPTQQVWDQAYNGQCPIVSQVTVTMSPLGLCFVDLGQDVHYEMPGHLAVGIIENAAIEQGLAGQARDNSALVSNVTALLNTVVANWEEPI